MIPCWFFPRLVPFLSSALEVQNALQYLNQFSCTKGLFCFVFVFFFVSHKRIQLFHSKTSKATYKYNQTSANGNLGTVQIHAGHILHKRLSHGHMKTHTTFPTSHQQYLLYFIWSHVGVCNCPPPPPPPPLPSPKTVTPA